MSLFVAMLSLILNIALFGWLVSQRARAGSRRLFEPPEDPPSAEAVAIGHLLALDPGGWTTNDGYRIHHADSNIGVWVANGERSVHWWVGSPSSYGLSTAKDHSDIDRNHVWSAYETWRRSSDGTVTGALGPAAEALRRLSSNRHIGDLRP